MHSRGSVISALVGAGTVRSVRGGAIAASIFALPQRELRGHRSFTPGLWLEMAAYQANFRRRRRDDAWRAAPMESPDQLMNRDRRCHGVSSTGWMLAVLCLVVSASAAEDMSPGREIFLRLCVECHGRNGEGVAGKHDEPL